MRTFAGATLILALNSALCGAASQVDSADPVPFRLYRGYMILVEGNLGAFQNLTFLIDTGATSCLVNSNLARKLGLRGKEKTAVAYGKRLKVQSTILRELQVGTTPFRAVPTLIADFSLLPVIGRHIDVIVGMNALGRVNFGIDYRSRTLLFHPEPSLDFNVTPLSWVGLTPVVELEVSGQALRLLVDTGARDLILFRRRVKPSRIGQSTPYAKRIHHLSAQEELRMVQLSGVRFGDRELGNLQAYLQEGRILGYEDVHGILGVASLGLDRVRFNFDDQRLEWQK